MSDASELLMRWNAAGALSAQDMPRALRVAAVVPDGTRWLRFVEWVTIGAGAALIGVGIVFFIAYNWAAMPATARFALVEAAIVVAVAACLWRGPDTPAGIGALCVAAIAVGGLLALVGQTYQTGADTYELFAAWALAMLPWAVLGRQAPLWLIWLCVVNLAAQAWFARWGMAGFAGGQGALWTLLLQNAGALALWEVARTLDLREFRADWALRVVGVASGIGATIAGIDAIFDSRAAASSLGIGWALWLAALWYGFRMRRVDVFVLAVGLLSTIVVTAAFLGKHLFTDRFFASPLLVAAAVIGLAAGGIVVLRRIAGEEH
ncbi:MAG TPA: DUF2157 domain-containing protein [Casimicrobiaceae bacterium]|jgi:uncharacterized membrane protein|nr:DUF2157 domain-containing protein [Casimicrobiaceae bacterium]